MDPFSEVFAFLNIRAARCTRFEASGAWSFRFPAKPGLKFGAVVRGAGWIDMGAGSRHILSSGDCFLLANAPSYVLANDDAASPIDGITAFDWSRSDVGRHEGDDTVLVAGSFDFEELGAALLLGSLPQFLLIPSENPSVEVIRATLRILDSEIRGTQIGAAVLTDRLADILLVQVLRTALDQRCGQGLGWISALADARIGQAIRLMHADISHPWTLNHLANQVGMSRSAFTKRFRSLVGTAPLDYLLQWRMGVARDLLQRGNTVAATASQTGYTSESAFGHAFKRVHSQAPKRYALRQKQGQGSPNLTPIIPGA